jgi:hypothetical protein
MKAAPSGRLAAWSGLALTLVLAVWWLGATRRALDDGSDTARIGAAALQTLWLVRAVLLILGAVVAGALQGWRAGAIQGLMVLAPAWPLVALAGSASDTPWAWLLAAEALLLGLALALPGAGRLLRNMLRQPETAETVSVALGVALVLGLWWAHAGHWLPGP